MPILTGLCRIEGIFLLQISVDADVSPTLDGAPNNFNKIPNSRLQASTLSAARLIVCHDSYPLLINFTINDVAVAMLFITTML